MSRTSYFTPRQANAVIPQVMPDLAQIRTRVAHARALAQTLEVAASDEDRADTRARLTELEERIGADVRALLARGIRVKGLAPLLLDFPALRHGQEVFLCWREGEDRIEWWHPTHTGAKGRQRVDYDDLGVWEWEN